MSGVHQVFYCAPISVSRIAPASEWAEWAERGWTRAGCSGLKCCPTGRLDRRVAVRRAQAQVCQQQPRYCQQHPHWREIPFLKVAAKYIAGSARFCCRLALFCAQVCHCQVWSSKHVPYNAEDTKNGFKPFFSSLLLCFSRSLCALCVRRFDPVFDLVIYVTQSPIKTTGNRQRAMWSLGLRALSVIPAQAAIQYPVCEVRTSGCIDLPPHSISMRYVVTSPSPLKHCLQLRA